MVLCPFELNEHGTSHTVEEQRLNTNLRKGTILHIFVHNSIMLTPLVLISTENSHRELSNGMLFI